MQLVSTVLASEDHGFRLAVSSILSGVEDVRVEAEGFDRATALAAVERQEPDLLLLDARLDPPSGAVLAPEIRRVSPRTRTLMFCEALDGAAVARALRHNVWGCVPRTPSPSLLLRAIRGVMGGERWFPRALLAEALVHAVAPPDMALLATDEPLTERERDVVRCVSAGMTNKEIGRMLGISPTTVKTHLHHVFGKKKVGRRLMLLSKPN
ncbi:MAG TPA: response regulator transcription factor [Nevskiaceae bacterium]|nr:response regulator transcription factor [Nevskiaceae bacterium]